MRIVINEKTYIAPRVKAKLFREALVITKEKDLNDLTPDKFDEVLQFACDIFANQFKIDDIYEHLYRDELDEFIVETIKYALGGVEEEDGKKK